MNSTMDQIDLQDQRPVLNRRESLTSNILSLEKNIRQAEDEVRKSNEAPMGHMPITPEQANQRKKEIVFLKKDLAFKRSEIEELNS